MAKTKTTGKKPKPMTLAQFVNLTGNKVGMRAELTAFKHDYQMRVVEGDADFPATQSHQAWRESFAAWKRLVGVLKDAVPLSVQDETRESLQARMDPSRESPPVEGPPEPASTEPAEPATPTGPTTPGKFMSEDSDGYKP